LQNPHELAAHHTSAEENNLLRLRRTSDSVAPRLMILPHFHPPCKQIPARRRALFQGYTSADLAALLSTSTRVRATPRIHRAAYRDVVDHSFVAGEWVKSGEKQRRAR
jgi:hypothetical protein